MSFRINDQFVKSGTLAANTASGSYIENCRHWANSGISTGVFAITCYVIAAPTQDDNVFTLETDEGTPVTLGTISIGAASGVAAGDVYKTTLAVDKQEIDEGIGVRIKHTVGTTDATFSAQVDLVCCPNHY